MANEFKVRKGLIINGSGSTLLDVQGAHGQLFSVTDSLSGSLFGVSDISGIPIFEVFSDEIIRLGTSGSEAILVSGSTATITSGVLSGSFSGSYVGDGSGLTGLSSGAVTAINNATANELVTIGATTTELDAEANLTFDGTQLNVTGNITASGHIRTGQYLYLGNDVSIFNDGGTLRTDDVFHANNGIHVGGTGKIFDRSGTNSFIHFDHSNSKIRIQEGGEEMITIDSGNVTINAAEGTNSFKVFASSSDAHFFVSSSGMVVINNGTSDYFGENTRIQLVAGASSKAVGVRSNVLYLYSYSNGSEAKFIYGDGSANWGTFASDSTFKIYDYSISGPAYRIQAGGDLHKFLSGSTQQIYLGRGLTETTAAGRLKIYLRANDAVFSTYHYNSSLELRAGVSGSGYVTNWTRILLTDDFGGSGDIQFWVSGSKYGTLTNTGRLGIGAGTGTVQAGLHVTGSNSTLSSIRQSRAGYAIWDQAIDSSNRLQWGSRAAGSEGGTRTVHFTLTNDTKVGIGTGAPVGKLHIMTGTGTGNGNTVFIDRDGSGDYSGLSFATAGTVDWSIGQNSAGNFEVFQDGQDAQTRLTVEAGGNVGIGSSDPVELLDVAGTARVETGIVEGTIYVGNDIQHWGDGGTGIFFSGSTSTSNDVITLKTAATERLRVDSSGIVTINDTGEQGWSGAKLNVGDTGDGSSGINLLTSTIGNAYLIFSDVVDNSTSEYANQIRFAHDGMFLATQIGGTEIMRISGSGKVGIGTTNPAFTLDVFDTAINVMRVGSNDNARIIINSNANASSTKEASQLSFADGGSTKWTLYKETNQDLYLFNAAANRYPIHAKAGGDIVLMEDGNNLGIGPGTPASKLDVSGSIRVHQTSATKFIELYGGNTGNFINTNGADLYIRYGTDSGKSIKLDSNGNVTFTDRIFLGASAGSTADATISFSSASDLNAGGIYYDETNDYLRFRAADGDRAHIGSAGIFSQANVYSGTSGQFRNYSGVWKATTGTSGNGFNFSSADIPNAVTITGTASNILKITGSGTNTGIQIEKSSGSSASTAMLTHLRQGNSTFEIAVDENQNGGKSFQVSNSGSIRFSIGTSRTYNYNTLNIRNRTTGNNPPEIQFDRDDSSITNSNVLGAIVARGNDPSGFENGAHIKFRADGTWDSNDYPSRIEFATDQAGTMTNVLVLDSNQSSSFTGNVTITGNLEVTGTTTTVNSTNLDLSDNIIGLNRGAASNSNDSGLIIERGSTGDNAAFLWDESADTFIFGLSTATPDSTGNISYNAAAFGGKGFWTDTSAVSRWGTGVNGTAYGVLTWSSGYASIYATTGNRLRLGSHNSQGVMVISSSKVGIGTETPSGTNTTLHVHDGNIVQSGSHRLTISDGSTVQGSNHLLALADASYVQIKSTNNAIYLDANNGQVFRNGSNTQYAHFRTNNFLFNTGSASTVGGSAFMTLNVGATTDKPISIINDTTDGMYIRRYDSSGKYQIQTTVGNGNSGTLSLQSYGGSVSIGTTDAPGHGILEARGVIKSSGSAAGFFMEGAGSTAGDEARITLTTDGAYAGNKIQFMSGRSGSVHNNYEVRTGDNDNSSAVRLWISGSGNIGIGTQLAPYKLTVAGTVSASGDLYLDGDNIYLGTSETRIRTYSTYLGFFGSGGTAKDLKGKSLALTTDFAESAPTNGLYVKGNISGSVNSDFVIGGTINLPGSGSLSTREVLINAHSTRAKLIKESNAAYWQVAAGSNQFEITDAANDNNAKGNVLLRASGHDDHDNELALVPNDGKVGINTTSPIYTLHVSGAIYANQDHIYIDSGRQLRWGNSTQYIEGTNDTSLEFAVGSAVRMFISSSGNVGIGTTSPSSKLHIDSTSDAVHFTRTGQETYRIIHGTSGLYFTRPDSSALAFGVTQNSDFHTFDTSGNVLFAADASTSRIGIGTTSPTALLHVSGTNDVVTIEGSGSTILSVEGSQGQLFSVTDQLSGSLFKVSDISGTPILEVDSADRVTMGTYGSNTLVVTGSEVGIGTADPSYPVHVYAGGSERFAISGDVMVRGSTDLLITGTNRRLSFTAGTGTVRTTTSANLILQTNSTTALTIDTSRNLKLSGSAKLFFTDDGTNNYIQESSDNVLDFVTAGVVGLQLSGTSATMRSVNFNGNITTETDSNFNIGTNSKRFSNVYADTLHGTLSGTAATASYVAAASIDGTVANATSADNADTVDSLHASSFLRADASDSGSGNLHLSGTSSLWSTQVYMGRNGQSNTIGFSGYLDDDVVLTTHHDGAADLKVKKYFEVSSGSETGLYVSGSTSHGRVVGIGTSSPGHTLDVYASTDTSGTTTGTTLTRLWNYVGNDLSQQKTFIDFQFTDSNTNEIPQVRIGAEVGPNGDANSQEKEGEGAFVVYTNNSTGAGPTPTGLAERFRVDYRGYVGIGTNSPGHLLEVRGTADAVSIGNDSNTQTYIRFANTRGFAGYTGADMMIQGGAGKGIKFGVNNNSFNSGVAMIINDSGNVGIGTTSVTDTAGITPKLDVVGGITHTALRRKPNAYSNQTVSSGGTDEAAKFVTFDLSDTNSNDLVAIYTVLAEETSASGCYARIKVKLRKSTDSEELQIADVSILDLSTNVSNFDASSNTSTSPMLAEDSFILRVEGDNDIQLWIKKKGQYGLVQLFEDALVYEDNIDGDSSENASITYHTDASWQTPPGEGSGGSCITYMADTRMTHQFAFFTNTTSLRYLALYSGFLTGTASYNQRLCMPKPGRLVGMSIQANAVRSNNTMRVYDADSPTSYAQVASYSFSIGVANRNTWIPMNLGIHMNGTAGDDNAWAFGIQCSSSTSTNWNAVAVFQF